jgi:cyclohexyl-isocyanide hydratase
MPKKLPLFTIAIPIYAGVDLLDVAAPCELFSWLKENVAKKMTVDVRLVNADGRVVKTRDGLKLTPTATFAKTPKADLLWVPGANVPGLKAAIADETLRTFLLTRSRTATYVTSVCEGALILASAGLLDGLKATTHWAFIRCLKAHKRVHVDRGFPRFVMNKLRGPNGRKRYVVTGGGISSGLDEALQLILLIAGPDVAKAAQLTTQYFPDPPVRGHIPKIPPCPLDDPSDES